MPQQSQTPEKNVSRLLHTIRGLLQQQREYSLVNRSGLFDREWYSTAYPDVAAAGGDTLRHYLIHGWKEGRDPSAEFSSRAYLESNPDAAHSGVNPLVHYLRTGGQAGRSISKDDLAPIIQIDQPHDNQSFATEITLVGWALSASGNASLKVRIDGQPLPITFNHFAREDVAIAQPRYQSSNPLPGFSAVIQRAQFPKGLTHTLEVCLEENGQVAHSTVTLWDRNQLLLKGLRLEDQEGLEIGPLNAPLVTKEESNGNVFYVDRASTEEIKEIYHDDTNVRLEDIVNVDFVCLENTLSDAVGGREFDYVIASHVIEHVPDMLGWLKEIAEVLRDGGILSLAIPDKRYTFDLRKEVSTAGKFLEAYLRHQRRPGAADVFDHISLKTIIDLSAVWDGSVNISKLLPVNDLGKAYELALDAFNGESYHNVHVHVFTPTSFISIIETFTRIGLVDYRVCEFQPTLPYTNEFFIQLQRLPRSGNLSISLSSQLEGIRRAREKLS